MSARGSMNVPYSLTRSARLLQGASLTRPLFLPMRCNVVTQDYEDEAWVTATNPWSSQ